MFGSREAIAKAKGELVEALPPDGTAVLNADDPQVAAMADRTVARVVRFGLGPGAEVRAEEVALDDERPGPRSRSTRPGGTAQVHPARPRRAPGRPAPWPRPRPPTSSGSGRPRSPPAWPAAASRPCGWRSGAGPTALTVLNDAYNANPTSMAAALKTLAALGRPAGAPWPCSARWPSWAPDAADEHDRIGRLAARLGIDRLVGVGEPGRVMVNAARMEGMWPEEAEAVAGPDAALALLAPALGPADVVLVKASRVVALDRVADALLDLAGPGDGA